MTKIRRILPHSGAVAALCLATALTAPAAAVWAQGGMFSTVLTVNGLGVTEYDIDQRMKLMQALREAGDLRKEATDGLIDDRLREAEAKRQGVTVSDDDIKKGMDDFASRGNITGDQLVAELEKSGVSREAFRDFIRANLLWREVIRARYAGRVAISDSDVDRALMLENARGAEMRVLLSEIIIPAPAEYLSQARELAARVSKIRSEAEFENAARQVSAAQTRENGGKLDWMPLEHLPPMLRPVILGLRPGVASAPVELNGAIGVFMLRGLDAGAPGRSGPQTLGYATLALGPAGDAAGDRLAARVAADAKDCDDLYTVAKGAPAGALIRTPPADQGAIPGDVAMELAHLDVGETTILTRAGGARSLVMLCSRARPAADAKDAAAQAAPQPRDDATANDDKAQQTRTSQAASAEGADAPARDAARNRLLNERINAFAQNYLADLRAEAVIARR